MSFARILRSSAIMGGAQVVVLASSFIRAKAIALILGASGVGLIGIFSAFSGNLSAVAGLGLGTSGVRLITGAEEHERSFKVAAVRRMGWMLGTIGLILGLLAFWPTAKVTFNSSQYAAEMVIVAFAVPCLIASSAWSAVLQASGKIDSLAKVQIAGALSGLLLSLPAIYFWGTMGIALSIFLAAAVPAIALWYASRSAYPSSAVSSVHAGDLRQLVKLGGALMVVGWLGQLSAYLVRLAIIRQDGLEAAGYYQAAFAISGSLPGFVFAAMGADFFPRISGTKTMAEAQDQLEKQIQAGILLGVPLIAVLLTLGHQCLNLLYTDSFNAALPLLGWMTWGVFLKLISWPIGFWLIAKTTPKHVLVIESVGNGMAILLPLAMMPAYGLKGVALGFFWASLAYLVMLIGVYHRYSGHWLGPGAIIWSTIAAAGLFLADLWAAGQTNLYLTAAPALSLGVFSAWKYRQLLKT
jgi:PST family polysaccharide transporter